MSLGGDAARRALDAAAGLLSFDELAYTPPRLHVLWLENSLDCRTWSYYCDIREAMGRIHKLCTPRGGLTCVEPNRDFKAQLVVVGPRYTANVAFDDETIGFDRSALPSLPIVVLQNKMYAATTREIVGDAAVKLRWAKNLGAVAALTWLTQHRDFTTRSGVPHHWMPFGVDAAMYGRHAGTFGDAAQPFAVGFTGAVSSKYPLREAILAEVKSMNVTSYLGTWKQTALNKADNRSWKALDREGYAAQLSKAKMWVSTTGPSNIVGTRYFEVLASGTTLLLCNRPPAGEWIYDGLFEDGVHVATFGDMPELRRKILYYLSHEEERRKVVLAAHALVKARHSWDARARFVTKVAMTTIAKHDAQFGSTHTSAHSYYTPRPPPSDGLKYVGCYEGKERNGKVGGDAMVEVKTRRMIRRYRVTTCAESCRKRYFALNCGGFCSGNGHRLGRCFCGDGATDGGGALSWGRRRDDAECQTTCALHDSRPCGGAGGKMAVYFRHSSAGIVYTRNATEAREAGARRRQRRKQAAAEAAAEAAEPIEQPGFVESAAAAANPHTADGALPPLRIVAKDCGAGFFALLLYAVNQLIWAEGEAKGRKSRVEFGRRCQDGRPNRYYDGAKGPNVWEYYFEPVSDAGPAGNELILDAKTQFHLHHMAPESVQTYPHGVHRHLKVPKWVYDEAWHLQMRSQASRILTEHVHIRPAILRKAAAFYAKSILGRSTSSSYHEPTAAERAAGVAAGAADTRPLLGVHVRGTDKIRNVGGRIIKPAEYFPIIAEWRALHPAGLIYVATDSPSFAAELVAALGSDTVVMYDALRSERNAFADSSLTDNYRKGEDALIEALILSCANFLVKPASALSEFAVYFSPSLHTHTIELQYEIGRPHPNATLRASVGGARDAARGAERCPPFLQPYVREAARAAAVPLATMM